MIDPDENARKVVCLAQECCQGPVDAVLMRKFFKTATKTHWENARNHGRYQEVLGCYSVDPDSENFVDIGLSFETPPEKAASVPRITVAVGDSKVNKLVLGNEGEYSEDNSNNETSWQINSSLVISHVFRDADLAQIAAQSTFEFFSAFHADVRKTLGLQSFEPTTLSIPRLIAPYPKPNFRVDAVFQLNYNFVITVNTESHRLKTVSSGITIP